jgi:hypothetical protein
MSALSEAYTINVPDLRELCQYICKAKLSTSIFLGANERNYTDIFSEEADGQRPVVIGHLIGTMSTTLDDASPVYKPRQLRPPTIREFLSFAADYPHLQCTYRIFSLGTIALNDASHSLVLSVKEGERCIGHSWARSPRNNENDRYLGIALD